MTRAGMLPGGTQVRRSTESAVLAAVFGGEEIFEEAKTLVVGGDVEFEAAGQAGDDLVSQIDGSLQGKLVSAFQKLLDGGEVGRSQFLQRRRREAKQRFRRWPIGESLSNGRECGDFVLNDDRPCDHVSKAKSRRRRQRDNPQDGDVVNDSENTSHENADCVQRETVGLDDSNVRHSLAGSLAAHEQFKGAVVKEAAQAPEHDKQADEIDDRLGTVFGTGQTVFDGRQKTIGDDSAQSENDEHNKIDQQHQQIVDEPGHEPSAKSRHREREFDVLWRFKTNGVRHSVTLKRKHRLSDERKPARRSSEESFRVFFDNDGGIPQQFGYDAWPGIANCRALTED